jgi:hypothetical protein
VSFEDEEEVSFWNTPDSCCLIFRTGDDSSSVWREGAFVDSLAVSCDRLQRESGRGGSSEDEGRERRL